MNNDGHAAALNRAVLMPLLMGRHRWFVHLADFFSWAGHLLGRFPHPFRTADKHAHRGSEAWGLRGRQPLSAVLTRTGEGGGLLIQPRSIPPSAKPGEKLQISSLCVASGRNYDDEITAQEFIEFNR